MEQRLKTRYRHWRLNRDIAALGAYSTILVEAFYLILGGFENASPLSISLITNGSAIIVAGFESSRATPLAAIRILLTNVFLLTSIILVKEGEHFDGTYAALCSFTHLVSGILIQHEEQRRDPSQLPDNENGKSKEDISLENENSATAQLDNSLERSCIRTLSVHFGTGFQLEGSTLLFLVLGTALTYRVFDFDLGFGLVFASLSAIPSVVLLVLINSTRLHGRHVDIGAAIKRNFISPCMILGPATFIFSLRVDVGAEIPWWKPVAGVAWFVPSYQMLQPFKLTIRRFWFLFMTTWRLCRFLIHVSFFPCLVCRQRAAELDNSHSEVVPSCPWDNCTAFTKAEHGPFYQHQTVLRITHHRYPDRIERFWLNDVAFFRLIPKRLIYFVCIHLTATCITVNIDNINRDSSFTALAESLLKALTFYVVIAFTLDAARYQGYHDGFKDTSPLNAGRWLLFPRQTTVTTTVWNTLLVHVAVISTTFFTLPVYSTVFLSSIVPPLCACMALFVLAGVLPEHQTSGGEQETATIDTSSEADLLIATKSWHFDSVFVLSSSRIRHLDLRLMAMGFAVLGFEAVWSRQYWQIPSYSSILVTLLVILQLLMNFVSTSQCPGSVVVVVVTASALTGNFSYFDFLGFFAAYHNYSDGENNLSQPLKISLWHSVLLLIILEHGNHVRQRERRVHLSNADPPPQDPLLMRIQVGTSSRGLTWELRNARIVMALALALGASQLDSTLPLLPHTIIASLTIMILVMGFQKRSMDHEPKDQRSITHLGALFFCPLVTWSTILLNGVWIFDFQDGWHAGAFGAFFSYCFFTTYADRLKRWFHAANVVDEGRM